MKILLIEDVDNLGYAGEVREVKNGYARNYLLPQKLAILATPGALNQAETISKAAEKRRARRLEDAKAMVNQIEGLELLFERRAGETGKLYGSVTSNDIAEAIEAKTGIALDKRKIALPEPVRQLGEFVVNVKLMVDLQTTINIEVLPEGGIVERERQARLAKEKAAAEAEKAAQKAPAEQTSADEAEPQAEDLLGAAAAELDTLS